MILKKQLKKVIEMYIAAVKAAKLSGKTIQVDLQLEANPDNKSQWKIVNETAFAQKLATAFFAGQ
ncbi:hypothetical protein MFLO_10398 [Listeria floridensis FSL S10-1187]|uniref:Uncharacterized protein n=2 Tax=Listeria floridensis TaxID=1494962 RepID=A0ABN0RE06_9LIST|nr:hypothetical protein MFLO_10398 [Listeria floridensis FSL S10-1187]